MAWGFSASGKRRWTNSTRAKKQTREKGGKGVRKGGKKGRNESEEKTAISKLRGEQISATRKRRSKTQAINDLLSRGGGKGVDATDDATPKQGGTNPMDDGSSEVGSQKNAEENVDRMEYGSSEGESHGTEEEQSEKPMNDGPSKNRSQRKSEDYTFSEEYVSSEDDFHGNAEKDADSMEGNTSADGSHRTEVQSEESMNDSPSRDGSQRKSDKHAYSEIYVSSDDEFEKDGASMDDNQFADGFNRDEDKDSGRMNHDSAKDKFSDDDSQASAEEDSDDDDSDSQPLHELSDEEFRKLQYDHKEEKYVHFFEIVMAAVLRIPLAKPLKLTRYAAYIADCTVKSREVTGRQFNKMLTVLGREIPAAIVSTHNKGGKIISKYALSDSCSIYPHVYSKSGSSNVECRFLGLVRDMVKCGDFTGLPLLLHQEPSTESHGTRRDKNSESLTTFFIPDYGKTLATVKANYIDNQLLPLSLLSTLCSIPFSNPDLHSRNVCVYKPETAFDYKWTVQIGNNLFEISWTMKGMLTTIDWEKTNFPNSASLTSSSYIPFSPQLWELTLRDYSKFGLEGLSGYFTGESGMSTILHYVFKKFEHSLYKVKHFVLSSFSPKNIVTNTLEVFPSLHDETTETYYDTMKKAWNRIMTNTGKMLMIQRSLTAENIKLFASMLQDFIHGRNTIIHEIPSDTGLVALRNDGKLIATKSIDKGVLITYVPITKHEMFDNQRIWVNSVQGSIVKKISPFCGFGGFVGFHRTKFNCSMMTAGEKGNFVGLVATEDISADEILTCDRACLVDRRIRVDEVSDFSNIMSLLIAGLGSEARTRRRSASASKSSELFEIDTDDEK